MLGRTASGIFWMARYLERAENTARLLDAGFRMAMTRDAVTSEDEWRSVVHRDNIPLSLLRDGLEKLRDKEGVKALG